MSNYILYNVFVGKIESSTSVRIMDFSKKSDEIQNWMKTYPFRGSWSMANKRQLEGSDPEIGEPFVLVFLFENERDAFDFKLRFA